MDEPSHTEMFSHDCSSGLGLDAADFKNLQSQKLDFFLVLDLEGKVEILEFPVLLFDAKTMSVVDFFHRFVAFLLINLDYQFFLANIKMYLLLHYYC